MLSFLRCCRGEGRPRGDREGPGGGLGAQAAHGDLDGSEAAPGRPRGTPDGPQRAGLGRRGKGRRRPVATQAHHQEEEKASHLQEQVRVLREQVSDLQVENQQVKQKASNQQEENSHLLAEIHSLKQEAEVLKEQVSDLQVENQQVKQKARDQEEENSHLLSEIQRAKQHECDHLFTENQWLKEQVQVLEEQVSNLQVENQQVKQKARNQQEENCHLLVEIHSLKQEAEVLKEHVSDLQVENQQVKQKARDQQEENSHLLAEIQRAKQHECEHLLAENQWLKEQVSNFQVENQQVKHKPQDQEEVPVEYQDQDMVPRLSAENQRLKEQVHTLILAKSRHWAGKKQLMKQAGQDREGLLSQAASGVLQAVKKRLPPVPAGLSPGKVFHVQIQLAGKTGGCERQFLKEVSRILSKHSVSLRVEEFREGSRGCLLLLVFCPIASRMGTDIQNALEGLRGNQKAILVVMHYLPKDNTETFLDTRRQGMHPALVRTVHTRYTLQDGFYLCEVNKAALADVADTINGLAEDP